MSGEILAMFPHGVSVRCYDCSSVTQVRFVLVFDCIVQLVGAFKFLPGSLAPIRLEVLELRQVATQFLPFSNSSVSHALHDSPCSYNTNPDG